MRVLMLTVLTCVTAAAQAQVSVSATVSSPNVRVGTSFSVTVKTDTPPDSAPVLPEIDKVQVRRNTQAWSSRQEMSFGFGKSTFVREFTYTFQLVPLEEGRITIPPITVSVGGKDYQTKPIQVTASPRAVRTTKPRTTGQKNTITLEDVAFLESRVNKTEVFEGEAILATVEIWQLDARGITIMGAKTFLPEFNGFYPGARPETSRRETLGNFSYSVHEVTQYLYPTVPGDYTIGAWSWEGTVLQGFNRYARETSSETFRVHVKPLPARPGNFSGAVGTFTVAAALGVPRVVQGEPTELRLHVRGRGNPDTIGAPTAAPLDWAHVGGPQIQVVEPSNINNWQTEKIFTYIITPHKAGNHQVPPPEFVYFDTDQSTYRTADLKPLPLTVTSSGESGQLIVAGGIQQAEDQAIKILGEDINPIVTRAYRLSARRTGTLVNTFLLSVPPLAYGGFFLLMRRRRRFEEDPRYARNYFARAKSRQRLQAMDTANDPADVMYRAVIGYLADKFNVNEAGLTSNDARALLEDHGADPGLVENLVKILRACERRRYGAAEFSNDELQALRQGAEQAMDTLDAATRKGGPK